MKLKNRLIALCLFCLGSLIFVSLLSTRLQDIYLEEEIKYELQKLSVEWDFSANLPMHSKYSACIIPSDVHTVCTENMQGMSPPPSCPLEDLSQDCHLLKYLHGYDKPVDAEELSFPLAFGLKMHTAPEQAEQLLRAIYRPHNVYCIHVDLKSDDAVFRVMKSLSKCFTNVIMTDRIEFVYGSYDAIDAERITMNCALNSGVNWQYYLNLAGQEFPLRTNLEMVRVLKMLNGTNDIESFPFPDRYKSRITYMHSVLNGEVQNTSSTKEPPPFNVEVRKGSQYGAFSRAFVASVFKDERAKSIMHYFKNTLYPEENIWATINQLPSIPGGYPIHVKHNPANEHISRAIAWEFFDAYQCRGEYVREVCIFTHADLPWLLRQPNLFANKFRLEMDSQAVACLEAVVDQRTRFRAVNLNQSYYLNLPHVRYAHRKRRPPSKF